MRLHLTALALLLVSLPVCAHAQSLADVARDTRNEKQTGTPRATKVYTNEDMPAPPAPPPAVEPAAEQAAPDAASGEKPAEAGDKPATDAAPAKDGDKAAAPCPAECVKEKLAEKPAEKKKTPEEEREERRASDQKRTADLNKAYTDRIQKLKDDIVAAQLLLTKLQTQQLDKVNEYKRTNALSQATPDFVAEQNDFNSRIAGQKELISSLQDQLEAAREAARHAGVPHAYD